MKKKPKLKTIPWSEVRAEWMEDPLVQAAYERIGPIMDMAFALSDARHEAGLTQAKVAKRMGPRRRRSRAWSAAASVHHGHQSNAMRARSDGGR